MQEPRFGQMMRSRSDSARRAGGRTSAGRTGGTLRLGERKEFLKQMLGFWLKQLVALVTPFKMLGFWYLDDHLEAGHKLSSQEVIQIIVIDKGIKLE